MIEEGADVIFSSRICWNRSARADLELNLKKTLAAMEA